KLSRCLASSRQHGRSRRAGPESSASAGIVVDRRPRPGGSKDEPRAGICDEHASITIAIFGSPSFKEESVYAAIRQGKAKTGMAEELARRIKEGAIPIISDVEGFVAYYVVYAPDDTVTAISIFNDYAGAEESNRRVLAWIEQSLTPLLAGPATAMAGPVIVYTLA